MLIVDAQIHLWNAGNPASPWHRQIPAYLKEDALKEMGAGGVDAAILTPHTPWDPNANELRSARECSDAASPSSGRTRATVPPHVRVVDAVEERALLYVQRAGGWASAAVLLRVYATWVPSDFDGVMTAPAPVSQHLPATHLQQIEGAIAISS